jgi:hypothetical protein
MKPQQGLPSRDAVTAFQINSCLSIAQSMGQFLAQPDIDPANPHKPGGAMDGGARASAEVTFVKACARLDSILEDQSRWNLEVQRLLELQMVKLMNDQMLFVRAQTAASLALNTPTYLHEPVIVNLGDGSYAAILGDFENPACIGIGPTPAEACADFDKAFRGESSENRRAWLAANPEQPEKPKTNRKKR